MKKLFLFVLVLIILANDSFSQQAFNFISSSGPTSQNSKPVPNVNAFTGKLGLSVPIYQYKSPSSTLAFAVSLDYSTGGLNLNQNPSSVGTGWNLNAGGSIHRIINGKPDDFFDQALSGLDRSGYAYAPNIPADNICPFKYRLVGDNFSNPDDKTVQDSEPDEFQFSFLGKQGSFIIKKNSLPGTSGFDLNPPQPITRPQSNLKFGYYTGGNAINIKTNLNKIIITDDNGIEYTFNPSQTTQRKRSKKIDDGSENYHYEYTFIDEYYITGWNLTKIKDLNSSEEVVLEYETFSINTKAPKSLTFYKKNGSILQKYTDDRNYERGKAQRLVKVTLANGDVVNFEYDHLSRCDYLSDKALRKINIGNTISYGLNFVYYKASTELSYSNCSSLDEDESRSKWLFLKSISRNVTGSSTNLADFSYITSSTSYGSSLDNVIPTRKEVKNQDLWGFYNGGEVTSRTCPLVTGLCQTPNSSAAEIGSLKQVNYPSGGSLSIEYEGNSVTGTSNAYGIRVKKITESDGINTNNNITKEYKYLLEDGQSSGFSVPEPPTTYDNKMRVYSNGSWTTDSYNVYSSSTVSPLTPLSGSPVAYRRVEEVISTGKIVTEFRSFSEDAALNTTYTYPFASKDRVADWLYGVPMRQLTYDKTETLVKLVRNTYNTITNTFSTAEFKSMKTAFQTESTSNADNQTDDNALCIQNALPYEFKYDEYYPVTGRTELNKTVEENYLKNGQTFTNTVDYEYDPNKFYLKKVTGSNSTNDKLEKIMFYPHEYTSASSTYQLVQKNIQSLPVSSLSILTKPDGSKYIVGFEKSEFQQMTDLSVRTSQTLTMKSKSPVSISSTKTTFTPEEDYGEATQKLTTDVTFNNYDTEGKIRQTTSKETTSSAIWDNEQKVVVAKANASKDDIAFSSFETVEKGNWSYTGNGFYEITAPAGKKCYNLTGNTISKSGLTSTIIYIVSYRSKNGSYNVNGTSAIVSGSTVNDWTYYKHKITGATQINITGNGLIDELRLHPETARMTSITYEPLIGVTSESGTEEEITKYEYDAYGRVIAIKNHFGNVVKVFCYNSAGQVSACGDASVFKNASISQIFYKTNCASGQGVLYTVPQGRYISFINQADAEAQAVKDLQTFGKDDITGVCSTVTVYARRSYKNVWRSPSGGSVYGDVVVDFFADANCTQLLYVSDLSLSYSYSSTPSGPQGENIKKVATGSTITLETNVLLQWQQTDCEGCSPTTYSTNYYLDQSLNYQIAY